MNAALKARILSLTTNEIAEISEAHAKYHCSNPISTIEEALEWYSDLDYTYEDYMVDEPNGTPDEFIFWWRD